jgi:four helix bundle protein
MEYTLENLEVYNLAEAFSDEIWTVVIGWERFTKDTIGKQLARASDSISANIAEGYGRYYYKESKQFYFYARGSIQETKSWLSKCLRRRIIDEEIAKDLLKKAERILAKLNAYIKFIANSPKSQSKTLSDPFKQSDKD